MRVRPVIARPAASGLLCFALRLLRGNTGFVSSVASVPPRVLRVGYRRHMPVLRHQLSLPVGGQLYNGAGHHWPANTVTVSGYRQNNGILYVSARVGVMVPSRGRQSVVKLLDRRSSSTAHVAAKERVKLSDGPVLLISKAAPCFATFSLGRRPNAEPSTSNYAGDCPFQT